MTSSTFFPTSWPTSTYGPGLQNYEIHAEQSSKMRGWSTARAALILQTLYKGLESGDADHHAFFYHDGNLFCLGRGLPLPCFLDAIEAKYKDISVFSASASKAERVNVTVLRGQCVEELVLGSQNWGHATQFSWAFRWAFVKSEQRRVGKVFDDVLEELD